MARQSPSSTVRLAFAAAMLLVLVVIALVVLRILVAGRGCWACG